MTDQQKIAELSAALKALIMATTTDTCSWETEEQVKRRIQECRRFGTKILVKCK